MLTAFTFAYDAAVPRAASAAVKPRNALPDTEHHADFGRGHDLPAIDQAS